MEPILAHFYVIGRIFTILNSLNVNNLFIWLLLSFDHICYLLDDNTCMDITYDNNLIKEKANLSQSVLWTMLKLITYLSASKSVTRKNRQMSIKVAKKWFH